jgi:hypothetical protein
LPTITGASTLACLLAASISVETVTPPIYTPFGAEVPQMGTPWDGPLKELLPILVEREGKSMYLKN